jgi:hypothetical protein
MKKTKYVNKSYGFALFALSGFIWGVLTLFWIISRYESTLLERIFFGMGLLIFALSQNALGWDKGYHEAKR